jgi:hypothetical protein
MMAHAAEMLKPVALLPLVTALDGYVRSAADQGLPAHEVETAVWQQVLAIGRAALGHFFDLQGPGDVGPDVQLPNGNTAQRLEQTHSRPYRSVFGDFTLQRTVYGSREGQKIDFVPLDARLQLPQSDYSYLLQKWDLALGCESSFARVGCTLFDILGLKQSVDSLEHMSRAAAEHVEPYRQQRPLPQPEEEGEIFVEQADGKGVVMRREAVEPKVCGHRKKGEKPNQKRMAIVGTVYSVKRRVRTPEEVVESLFRDPQKQAAQTQRVKPVAKHVWASLSHEGEGKEVSGTKVVFTWLKEELAQRNPQQSKETVNLMDGQVSLWDAREQYLPKKNATDVLDLLHVTPRLWEAANLFYKEGSDEATAFVKRKVLAVLEGDVVNVVISLRQMGKRRNLKGSQHKRLQVICNYLSNNSERMRYDEYLAKGYPIASGVIEGACRHYVKDRMERAGMHWTKEGAQAMLDVRSEFLNGDWEDFLRFRIEQETNRLYPHREVLQGVSWPLAV